MRALLEKLPHPLWKSCHDIHECAIRSISLEVPLGAHNAGTGFLCPGILSRLAIPMLPGRSSLVLAADERRLQLSDARSFTGADK